MSKKSLKKVPVLQTSGGVQILAFVNEDGLYDIILDKTTVAICDTGSNYKTQAVFINDSGLYSLIFARKY